MADRFERQNQWPGTQQQCVGAVVSTVVLRPHVKHVKIKVQVLVPRPSWPTNTGQERSCIMQTDPSFVRLFRGRKYRIDCRNAALKKTKKPMAAKGSAPLRCDDRSDEASSAPAAKLDGKPHGAYEDGQPSLPMI